jgi:hypothetical protein
LPYPAASRAAASEAVLAELGFQVAASRTSARLTAFRGSSRPRELTQRCGPGATYNVPITFNIYDVAAGNTVGTLIATKTQTFAIPYRPSADLVNCTGGKWYNGSACSNGLANNIVFTFPGTTLPNHAIFGIAFNTDHFGYTHLNGSGNPTDSLNIATYPGTDLTGATSVPALVGAWLPDNLSSYASMGSVPTTFIGSSPATSFNAGAFGPFGSLMPAVQITATN